MKVQGLPFLHFLVRVTSGRDSWLVSPSESKGLTASGGAFFAPLGGNKRFLPTYRFHFSVYLGNGEFLADGSKKALFDGIAVPSTNDGLARLLLTFELPGPEPWWRYDFWPLLPRTLRSNDEYFLPLFRRVLRRPPVKYRGDFWHTDFGCLFVELEPTEPKVLDEILDRFRISLIGCDPTTEYKRRSGRDTGPRVREPAT